MKVSRKLPYSLSYTFDNVPKTTVATPLKDFFENTSADIDCAVTSCKILSRGCASEVSVKNQFLTIGSAKPWDIGVKEGREEGFPETKLCIECKNIQ